MNSGALVAAMFNTACLARLRKPTAPRSLEELVARRKTERRTLTASKLFWNVEKPRMHSSRLMF